jgi:hypothetical protein
VGEWPSHFAEEIENAQAERRAAYKAKAEKKVIYESAMTAEQAAMAVEKASRDSKHQSCRWQKTVGSQSESSVVWYDSFTAHFSR